MAPPKQDTLRWRREELEGLVVSWESATEALLILFVAFVIGLGGGAVQCYEYMDCYDKGLCTNASRWRAVGLSCSFTNHVTVQADALYGGGNGTFTSLTRSVCAPGERLHTSSLTGSTECAPYRSWPNALNTEIMQPGATSRHMEMCGEWIDAGAVLTNTMYWSFYDQDNANAAVQNAEAGLYASTRLSATDMGKFYTACASTILGGTGAIRSSAKEAYVHLNTGLSGITSTQRVMEGAGWLASHACDGPAQVGVTVDGAIFKASIMRGSTFSSGSLAQALFSVDEPLALQDDAERANTLVNANAMSSPMATMSQLEWVFEGATGRTDHNTIPLLYGVTPELDGLVWLAEQQRYVEAEAYLKGLAAHCAFALHGSLGITTTGGYHTATSQRPAAAALGRLKAPHPGDLLAEDVSNVTVLNASIVTFSQLQAEPMGNPQTDCITVGRFLFPDRIDEEHFDLMITDRLYDRLEEITHVLRESLKHITTNHAMINAVFYNPAGVVSAIETTRLRIAGAPRGTWAGIARDFSDGNFASGDGPMLMAIKQGKAMFADRTGLLFSTANVCAGPPVYAAMEANAYVYPGGDCSHMLLGVLRKPFADERYDNASLASRAGYVIAHELAHNSLVSAWNSGATQALLSRYTSNLYSEALADVMSAVAIVHSGLATGQQVCQHVSQLWCARTPMNYAPSSTASHPGPNIRGDALCSTLGDLGLL